MTQIQDFKDNAFQSVWDHAKQIFKPMLVISLLSTAMFYLIAFVSSEMFFPGFLQEYMNIVSLNEFMMHMLTFHDNYSKDYQSDISPTKELLY